MTHKYNIGDKVKIVKNIYGGCFDIGTIGKITGKEKTLSVIDYKVSYKSDYWWYRDEELELVSPKAKSMQNKANLCKPMQDEVEITKKSVDYTLNLGKYKIFATVSDKGITLKTMDDHDKFWFCNSTPEMLKNIGALIIEASKLK